MRGCHPWWRNGGFCCAVVAASSPAQRGGWRRWWWSGPSSAPLKRSLAATWPGTQCVPTAGTRRQTPSSSSQQVVGSPGGLAPVAGDDEGAGRGQPGLGLAVAALWRRGGLFSGAGPGSAAFPRRRQRRRRRPPSSTSAWSYLEWVVAPSYCGRRAADSELISVSVRECSPGDSAPEAGDVEGAGRGSLASVARSSPLVATRRLVLQRSAAAGAWRSSPSSSAEGMWAGRPPFALTEPSASALTRFGAAPYREAAAATRLRSAKGRGGSPGSWRRRRARRWRPPAGAARRRRSPSSRRRRRRGWPPSRRRCRRRRRRS